MMPTLKLRKKLKKFNFSILRKHVIFSKKNRDNITKIISQVFWKREEHRVEMKKTKVYELNLRSMRDLQREIKVEKQRKKMWEIIKKAKRVFA